MSMARSDRMGASLDAPMCGGCSKFLVIATPAARLRQGAMRPMNQRGSEDAVPRSPSVYEGVA